MVINQGLQGFFPTFGLNTERYGVSLCIQSECGKIRTGKTPNTDTFHTVKCSENFTKLRNSETENMKHGNYHQNFPKNIPKTSTEPNL